MVGRQRRGKSPAKSGGFTLIELLVVVIIIGILAAIALPNFIGAQNKAREASVKSNMRTAQIAAESYATDSAGYYPGAITTNYEAYFPGGNSSLSNPSPPPGGPINPFDGANEWPVIGKVTDVQQARSATPTSANAKSGSILYSPITAAGGSGTGNQTTAYAIEGSDAQQYLLGGLTPGTTLVLSNQ